jgi:hypothetical protein
MDLNFDGTGDISNKKFSFSASAIDFSIFPDHTFELLKLNFSDSAIPSSKKGGIVIKNTNYPPPAAGGFIGLEDFINKFTVSYVKFIRLGTTDRFTITIKILANNSEEEYTLDAQEKFEIFPRVITKESEILAFKVKEWPKNSGAGVPELVYPTINDATIPSFNTTKFPEGFPMTVLLAGQGWPTGVNRKILNVSLG